MKRTVYSIEFFKTSDCIYKKTEKALYLSGRKKFPPVINITSSHTGKSVTFKPVTEDDPLFDEDGYDGEMCIYRPTTNCPRVERLVVYF